MLHLNKKAEIQVLSSVSASGLASGPGSETSEWDELKQLEGLMGYVVCRLREGM